MKVESVLSTFVNSAIKVLKEEGKVEVLNRGELSMEKSLKTLQEINVLIAITGTIKGLVLYGMTEEMTLKIASGMAGENIDKFDEMARSAIGELGNIITGNALMELEMAGYMCKLSPPTLIIGKDMQISTLDIPRTVISLTTNIGEFEIDIAIKESEENDEDIKIS